MRSLIILFGLCIVFCSMSRAEDEMYVNAGFSGEPLRMELRPNIREGERKVIYFDNPLINRGSISISNTSGKTRFGSYGVDVVNRNTYLDLPVAFELWPGDTLIRIEQESSSFLWQNVNITDQQTLHRSSTGKLVFNGVVLACLLMLIIYNLIIYFKVREPGYLYYGFYFFFMSIMLLYMTGFGEYMLWGDLYSVKPYIEGLTISLMSIPALMFSSRVLNVKRHAPRLFGFMKVIMAGAAALLILTLSPASDRTVSIIANTLPMFLIVSIFIAVFIAIRKGDRLARTFLLGWSLFFIGANVRMMINWGVVPTNMITLHMPHVGIITEAIIFSTVLAGYIEAELDRKRQQVASYIDRMNILIENMEKLRSSQPKSQRREDITEEINLSLSDPLSDREIEVLVELSKGKTYDQIAETLFISKNTVKTHVSHIYDKLEASNRKEAVVKAMELSMK